MKISVEQSARLTELRVAARAHRDRFDFVELRKTAKEAAAIGAEAPWIAQMLSACDAKDAIDRASTDAALALALAGPLKAANEFALAARALRLAWDASGAADEATRQKLAQQLAQCIYKDEEIVPAKRLRDALAVLERALAIDPKAPDAETLRIAGAVYKRRWEIGGETEDLLNARAAYKRAVALDPRADAGYGAVNAAFLCDVLASLERQRAQRVGAAVAWTADQQFRNEAQALREDVKTLLDGNANDYWSIVTLAEALFGLGEYQGARLLLGRVREHTSDEWMIQSTARQLAALFAYQGTERDIDVDVQADAMAALGELAGMSPSLVQSLVRGKVGLALSGGGFRASLYHLGVLARLAEVDMLRHVEALSTVSGGSIVGAHYYLKVKRLLESRPAASLRSADFAALVDELIGEFLAGVRLNLRMRTLSNFWRNLQMFGGTYTRSTRLGDLYGTYFYPRDGKPGSGEPPLRMAEMLIRPADVPAGEGFNPKTGNWNREYKVPVLLLNATPLNTGHGWHFTARSMGEPPSLAADDIDCKPRLRRLYYVQAPTEALRDFPLGHAVAASAGVPGLFEPIVLEDLYPERTVRLVDGGVHDNQGVAGLLDEGCRFILCSDSSGQMGEQKQPPESTTGVLLRTNSILMDRVREAEYLDLDARQQAGMLTGFLFLHLKKDIGAAPLDWIGCQDASPGTTTGQTLPYGIDREIQEKLANLRTDLDAFTDEEAAALMASGYLMTEQELKRLATADRSGRWQGFTVNAPRGGWPFLQPEFVALLAQAPGASEARNDLGRRLGVGAELFFKVWRVDVLACVMLAVLLGAVGWLVWDWVPAALNQVAIQQYTWKQLLVTLAVLGIFTLAPALGWLRPDNMIRKFLTRLGLAFVGYVVCTAYLVMFNGRYLKSGEMKGFYRGKQGPS